MRKPTYSAVAATAALVLAAGGVGWAASLPANSVGSPQVKNGSVRSIDLKNGGVRLVDLAPDARIAGPQGPQGPQGAKGQKGDAPFVAMGGTSGGLGGCGQSGWCYVSNVGQGTLVARLSAAPPNIAASSWVSTGVLQLPQAARTHLWATATVWAFGSSNLDVSCTLYDGTSGIAGAGGGGMRMNGNTSQVVTIDRIVELAAGSHDLRLLCRGNGAQSHAVVQATISYEAMAS